MVRALLDGRKAQTRRVIKKAPSGAFLPCFIRDALWRWRTDYWPGLDFKCPYGQPGDLLWVRETWAMASKDTDLSKFYYKAHENASHTEFHELVPTDRVGR